MNPAKRGRACGEPKIATKSAKKRAASGMLAAGGITRRIASLGWSWWTPWIMKWRRSPPRNFGRQWKTRRWSQYSVGVQMTTPARTSSAVVPPESPRSRPSQIPPATTGRKTAAGIAGWTLVKKSRNLLSNIGGEAESRTVRSSGHRRNGNPKRSKKWNVAICGNVPDACLVKWHSGSALGGKARGARTTDLTK